MTKQLIVRKWNVSRAGLRGLKQITAERCESAEDTVVDAKQNELSEERPLEDKLT